MVRGIFRRDYNLRWHSVHPLYYVARAICRMVFFLYFRREVYGRQHLARQGGGILAANHASFLDPPLAGAPWPRPIYYFGRDTLFRGRFMTALMNICRTIPVRRGMNDIRAIRAVLSILHKDDVVLVFPEGTRTPDGRLQPGRIGAGMVAYKSRARIYPCYVDGTRNAWPRGSKFPYPVKLRVFYGRSFFPEALYNKPASRKTYTQISALMMQRIARLEVKARRLKRK